jgi:hypothetical protein
MKKLTSFSTLAIAVAVVLIGAISVLAKHGSVGSYDLFGDSAIVSPGFNSPTAAQFRSDVSTPPNYGGVDFAVPAGLTVADLDTLSADYMFTAGSCGAGSPRFQVNVDTGSGVKNIFIYIGPPPNYVGCPLNVWTNTGNLAAPANLVDATQLGGAFYMPYASVQTLYGSYPVVGLQVVNDSYYAVGGTQTTVIDNVQINNRTVTFENADSCKKDGWQQFTGAPGPFKNQGQCVSYFAKGGQ